MKPLKNADKEFPLVSLIRERMIEIGKPENHAFGQGELTWLFIEQGWVMISIDGINRSALYPDQREFKVALDDFLKESL